MAEENDDQQDSKEPQGKGKAKIIIIVLAVLLLIGATVGATMYFVGFFDPPPPTEEEQAALDAQGEDALDPGKLPAMYFPVKPTFIVNFQSRGRQRFLQVDVTVMTRDQQIFSAIQNHLPLIKNRLVMQLSGELYEDLQTAEGRELLRQKCMESVQQILKNEIGREDGVEQVLFTNFVMQ